MAPISMRNPPPHTQCAIGMYTNTLHSIVNIRKPENFTRSANAPRMRAGVMTANMHWNMTKSSSGMPPVVMVSRLMPLSITLSNPPMP